MPANYSRLQVRISSETEAWEDVSLETDGYRVPISLNTAKDGSGTWLVPLVDSDGHIQVDVLSGGGGTQYTEGDTDASITGTALMWEDAANTLRAASAAKPVPVEITDNSNTVSADIGSIKTAVEIIDNAISGNEMQVDIVSGSVDTELPSAAALGDTDSNPTAPAVGSFLMGWDTTQWTRIRTTIGDSATATGLLNVVPMVYNGSSYDRLRGTTAGLTAIHGITGIAHGVKTVTTAGTDVALAGSTACRKVVIQAQTDNTGLIAVGATGVDATEATGTGVILYAGDAFELEIDNLSDVFIDSTINGEGVRYTYFT